MAENKEEPRSLLKRGKEESKKAGLKLNIKKKLDHGIQLQHFMANRRVKVEAVISSSWALKSLWMTAAMKTEDNWFLAGKL